MNKFILISTPGVTDPIRGEYDGPLLHIARHYRPEKIFLLLSKKMGDKEKQYHCYETSLKLLGKKLNVVFDVQKVFMEICNPHSYDELLSVMEMCIKIKKEYSEYQILLNISSGTPQMETALCMIAISDVTRFVPVQVYTPEKGPNTTDSFNPEKDSVEEWFEVDLDNEIGAANRCMIPKLLNYRQSILQFQIESLLRNYDYAGARQIYVENQENFSEKTGMMLLHAQKRLNLEEDDARKLARIIGLEKELYPVAKGNIMSLIDFYNSMKIKQRRGELNDFVMRLEILTAHLGIYMLENCMHISLNDITTGKKVKKLRKEKCTAIISGIDEFLDLEFQKMEYAGFKWDSFLNGRSIVYILKYISQQERYKKYAECVDEMIEWNNLSVEVRNPAAHTITAIREENFKKYYNKKDSATLCESIKRVLTRVFGSECKQESFRIYETINEKIISSFDEK